LAANEVKILIDNLKPGMFVSRLDVPWIETPFALEGFLIQGNPDIEELRPYTRHVFIDVDQGDIPEQKHHLPLVSGNEPPPITGSKEEYELVRKQTYEIETEFEEEFEEARMIRERVHADFKRVVTHLQTSDVIEVDELKEGVHDSVESIIRNPSAFALLAQLEKSDDYAYNHALSTSVWCAQFGRHLGLDQEEIEELALGGMLLDVGKVKLPPKLFQLTRALSPKERELVNLHVDKGLRLLAKSRSVSQNILRMVATHHERADGSGYPAGLKNQEIPLFGRIAGILDSYDAMTTPTPYRKSHLSAHQAINELYNLRGTRFDNELVEQFIQTVGLFPSGSLVELNSGAVAIVLEVNPLKRLLPNVMLLLDKDKQPLDSIDIIDLNADRELGLMVSKGLPQGAYGINIEELFLDV